MDTKTLRCAWKADAGGNLVGFASTFGNVDLGGDVVQPGAFAKTLEELRANGIPLLADHTLSVGSVLGTIVDGYENAKGLVIEARFSAAPSAQDVRTKLREGHLSKLSIGYEPVRVSYGKQDGKQVRYLDEVKLWEKSVVVLPMNPEARVTSVKRLSVDLDDRLAVEATLIRLAAARRNP